MFAQDAFKEGPGIKDASKTAVVLCGMKGMTEVS